MVTSQNSVWLALGGTLAVVCGEQVLRGTSAGLPPGARLAGSPSGDVWTMSEDELQRVGDPAGTGADAVSWRKQLLPIFDRLCQACHLPAGSAHIDLSTYSAWAARRAAVGKRVVERTPSPMPPAGSGMLTAEELEAVRVWAARSPAP
jgi:mono/diheme cytochrome c family protein